MFRITIQFKIYSHPIIPKLQVFYQRSFNFCRCLQQMQAQYFGNILFGRLLHGLAMNQRLLILAEIALRFDFSFLRKEWTSDKIGL